MAPMVALMAAVHAWAPAALKALSLVALVFMGVLAGITCSLHFVLLTLSRQPGYAGPPWPPLVFAFRWPSFADALDIVARDVFFALSVLFAAPDVGGSRLALAVRVPLVASAALARGPGAKRGGAVCGSVPAPASRAPDARTGGPAMLELRPGCEHCRKALPPACR
jgi:hypothetical protein